MSVFLYSREEATCLLYIINPGDVQHSSHCSGDANPGLCGYFYCRLRYETLHNLPEVAGNNMVMLEQSHNTHVSTQSQASYLRHQLCPNGAPAVSPADDATHPDDVRLQTPEKLQVPEVDASGQSHF